MSRLPPMGEHEERRLRAEMADWSDSKLTAAEIKEPAFARGIAAKQILGERRAKDAALKHAELLREIRNPHWSVTPSFVLLVVTSLLSLVAVVLAALALPQVQQVFWPTQSAQASAPSSLPAPRNSPPESSSSRRAPQGTPAASIPASSPQKATGK